MLNASRVVAAAFAVALYGCIGVPLEKQYWSTGVREYEWEEIRVAMRKYTSSPVIICSRIVGSSDHSEVTVTTEDLKHYRALKINGRWRIRVIEGIIVAMNASNQAMERTADRCAPEF
jgi:hypothetical protein